ncbi:hypothetical protein CsSME_00005979 [Camellia sinensis var. sinensis]
MSSLSISPFLCIWVLLSLYWVVDGYGEYNTGSGIVDGKLNVHLVPHSHDDVGWLKTIDQYYVGSNNSIQGACVENVLDSVVVSLRRDLNRKFVFAEMAFFQRWWGRQNVEIQKEVRNLVHAGQLEFVNGGWCMHDEGACHYIDMIDQTTLGHLMIKNQFNITPRAGWQIDPFGHSAVQAYLLGVELGFDSVHFARIDYQDRAKRKEDKSLEVVWRGSKTFGSASQIFANAFPVHYSAPTGFSFEIHDDSIPVQDNPLLYDYNVEQRVNDFINAAITQANVTRTNHIMWTMGDDFQYQYAESWFKQMDKLIHYVNKVVRLYKDKEHAEVEYTIGPISTEDGVGKEVISRMTANMVTDKVFYTDSNGRDFLKRVRDYREDWSLTVHQPVSGNYYPLSVGIFTKDKKSEFSVLVDRATGGSSIEDGELELMLHRRMTHDDSGGLVGPLDEIVCAESSCEGLTVRGNYYISINQLGAGSRWRRTTSQEVYSPILLAFTHETLDEWTSSHLTMATTMDPNYSLPLNVALITLQELDDGKVLLRLAHLYEAGEDAEYSTLAEVELKKMFAGKVIKEAEEMSLSANQGKAKMKKMTWKVEGDNGGEAAIVRGGPVNSSTLVVELGPMEIRTFLLTF